MQNDKNNISKISNILKICYKVIKNLFLTDIKYFNFQECSEVKSYYLDSDNTLKYNKTFELNLIITIFLKYKIFSNFFKNLNDEENKIIKNFLLETKNLKNKLFHEEINYISEKDLKTKLYTITSAIKIITEKYSNYKIIKPKYLEYLKNISDSF